MVHLYSNSEGQEHMARAGTGRGEEYVESSASTGPHVCTGAVETAVGSLTPDYTADVATEIPWFWKTQACAPYNKEQAV